MHEHCPKCNLRYLVNYGDPFAFQAIMDRGLFVLPIIAFVFFGLHRMNLPLFIGLTAGLTFIMYYTTPHRYGVSVAIDYLVRLTWGDLKPDI